MPKGQPRKRVILSGEKLEKVTKLLDRLGNKTRVEARETNTPYEEMDLEDVTCLYDAYVSGMVDPEDISKILGWKAKMSVQYILSELHSHPIWAHLAEQERRGERSHTFDVDGIKVTVAKGVHISDKNLKDLIKLNIHAFLQSEFEATRALGVKYGMTFLEKFGKDTLQIAGVRLQKELPAVNEWELQEQKDSLERKNDTLNDGF